MVISNYIMICKTNAWLCNSTLLNYMVLRKLLLQQLGTPPLPHSYHRFISGLKAKIHLSGMKKITLIALQSPYTYMYKKKNP